jgi:hypothetical protein
MVHYLLIPYKMLKKVFYIFTLVLIIQFSYAQERAVYVTDSQYLKLTNLAKNFEKQAEENKRKAFALAAEKNWITFSVDQDGSIISLQGIDDLGFPIYLKTDNNTFASGTTKANSFYSGGLLGLSLNGSSENLIGKVGIWDGGSVLASHQEFVEGSRIEQKDNPSSVSEHSTHVAGTMMAKGVNPLARGMVWGLQKLYAWDYDNDDAEMTTASSQGMLISNHSYGFAAGWNYITTAIPPRWDWYGIPGSSEDYKFGLYDIFSKNWDIICYNAPYYLPVKSAGNYRSENGPSIGLPYYGFTSATDPTLVLNNQRTAGISSNDGYDIISTSGTAKNILTVGAIFPLPFGANSTSDIKITRFSSWGPTDDGRIKPDLVAAGMELLSTSNTSNISYATRTGTSVSSPNASGSVVLLQEYYSKLNDGLFMRSATLKGLAIHTTDEAGNTPGPDYIFGWGLLNVEKAGLAIKQNYVQSLISERTLDQGKDYQLQVVTSGYGPLKVTICWTDLEGIVETGKPLNSRLPKLINDLDLRISKGIETFFPWKLDPINPSSSATQGDNIVDNIEQITIPNSVPGETYTIKVSHKGTLTKGPQAYSIIATGIGGKVYCTSAAASTADSRIDEVKLNTINNVLPNTCRSYSDFKTTATALQAGQVIPISIKPGTCGSDKNKIVKVFIDWNSDGDFEDSNETVLTSPVISTTSVFSGNINVPISVIPGNSSVMRVVLSETSNANELTACGTYANGETQDYTVNFVKSNTDVGVIGYNNFPENICDGTVQQFSVRIKNFGGATISNIPVTLTLTSNGTVIKTITEIFTGSLDPNYEADFNLEGNFSFLKGNNYTITAKTSLTADVVNTNNSTSKSLSVYVPQLLESISAAECDNVPGSFQLNAAADGLVYWYATANTILPIEVGNSLSTQTAPIANKYYAGLNDFKSNFGPENKGVYITGNYSDNFVYKPNITFKAPMVLDSALLYISKPGKLTFTVETTRGEVLSSTTIDVQRTKTTPDVNRNNLIDDDFNDPGKMYKLGLEFPAAGTYYIGIAFPDGATIFRSNVGVSNIPFSLENNLITFNGSMVGSIKVTNSYYYFYNMKFKALGCSTESRVVVNAGKPTITQNGPSLVSSFGLGYQWYLNGAKIDNAAGKLKTYTPTQSGSYKVEIVSPTSCVSSSNEFNFFLTSIKPSDISEISLKMYPVPSNDVLNIAFDVNKREDVIISLTNILGQEVKSISKVKYSGKFSEALSLTNLNDGVYVVNIKIGGSFYTDKITVYK